MSECPSFVFRNWATSGAPISISSAVVTPSKALTRWLVELLAVLVQVDEAGGDDESGGVDDAASGERVGGDAGDLAVADADVAHGVETGFGVHDAPAFEDEVILLRGEDS